MKPIKTKIDDVFVQKCLRSINAIRESKATGKEIWVCSFCRERVVKISKNIREHYINCSKTPPEVVQGFEDSRKKVVTAMMSICSDAEDTLEYKEAIEFLRPIFKRIKTDLLTKGIQDDNL